MAEQAAILESIRDIISGKKPAPEEPVAAAPAAPAKAEKAPEPAAKPAEKPAAKKAETPAPADDEVLDLTDKVNEDGTVTKITPKAKKAEPLDDFTIAPREPASASSSSGDILSEIDSLLNEGTQAEDIKPISVEDSVLELSARKPIETHEENMTDDSILSDSAANDVKASFADLMAHTKQPAKPSTPSAHFRSGDTLEDLVVEMLKPMMKDWLDQNLPHLVREVVEKEVRKLTS